MKTEASLVSKDHVTQAFNWVRKFITVYKTHY